MKTRTIAASVLFAFLASTAPLTAFAQPDDPITKQARARFQEGVDFYDKGQFENARASFLQAYALKKHPAVLLNLAQSCAKAGHALEASKYFQQYLKEATTANPAQVAAAEKGLDEVRQKLGRVEIVAPSGTEVTVDDKERPGAAPFAEPIDVEPGSHVLKSRTPDGSSETVRVTANAGQRVQAKFNGGAAQAAPAPVVAPTAPSAAPAAEPASSPPSASQPDEGPRKHSNLFSRPENMTPVYIGLGVGTLGLAGTILFAAFKADAQSKADSVANDIRTAAARRNLETRGICSSTNQQIQTDFGGACQTLKDNNNKVDTNAMIANISLVVMGVGFVGAAGWYLFAPKHDDVAGSAKGPTIQPYAGWGNAGFTGSF